MGVTFGNAARAAAAAFAALALSAPAADAAGTFSFAAPMSVPREGAVAAAVQGGLILVAGGSTGLTASDAVATAEVYIVATNTWTAAASMNHSRWVAAGVSLPDGRALVVGGQDAAGVIRNDGEIYSEVTNAWTATAGTMSTGRAYAAAAPLGNGDVLVAGGWPTMNHDTATAEIWHHATGQFTAAAPMSIPRAAATAVPLPDGRVLVAGGYSGIVTQVASAEIYDAATNAWTAVPPWPAPRGFAVGIAAGGTVVFVGGEVNGSGLITSLVRDPLSEHTKWLEGPWLRESRTKAAGAAAAGEIVVAGGQAGLAVLDSVAVFKYPVVSIDPSPLDLGDESVTSATGPQALTVKNTGQGPLHVTAVNTNGGGFRVSSENCTTGAVAPNATCTVNVAFAPTSPGAKVGTVKLTDDSLASRDVVGLTGNGIGPQTAIQPSQDFGSVAVGAISDEAVFRLTNTGNADLHVSRIGLNGQISQWHVVGECVGVAVAPGNFCDILVRFKPTSEGAKAATIRVFDDTHARSHLLRITGQALPAT